MLVGSACKCSTQAHVACTQPGRLCVSHAPASAGRPAAPAWVCGMCGWEAGGQSRPGRPTCCRGQPAHSTACEWQHYAHSASGRQAALPRLLALAHQLRHVVVGHDAHVAVQLLLQQLAHASLFLRQPVILRSTCRCWLLQCTAPCSCIFGHAGICTARLSGTTAAADAVASLPRPVMSHARTHARTWCTCTVTRRLSSSLLARQPLRSAARLTNLSLPHSRCLVYRVRSRPACAWHGQHARHV